MNTAAEPRDGLLPCPGCGFCNTRVIGGPGTRGGPKYWAGCDTCHWRTWGNTEHDAIAEWNTRIAQARPEAGAINVPAAQALISHGITPAHAQRQEGDDSKWERLAGRGMHELRFDELPEYLMWLAENYADGPHVGGYFGAMRTNLETAIKWVVSELERKTNDERVLAVKLSTHPQAPSVDAAAVLAAADKVAELARRLSHMDGDSAMVRYDEAKEIEKQLRAIATQGAKQ